MVVIFENLLKTSIYSSFLVVVVMFLRMIFKRASRSTICLLWALVGIRLILLVPIESQYAVIPEISTNASAVNMRVNPYQSDGTGAAGINFPNSYTTTNIEDKLPQVFSNIREYGKEYLGTPESENEELVTADDRFDYGLEKNISLMELLSWIWLAGTLVMLFYGIIKTLVLKRRLTTSVRDVCDKGVFYTECTKSAFIYGIRSPKIYVGFCVTDSDKTYIVNHEKEHIRRMDHITKFIGYILLSFYWFAPWVWVALAFFCKDMELACDECIIKSMNSDQRSKYAETLYKYGSLRILSGLGLVQFGEVSIKERIRTIMNFNKKSKWASFIVIGALIVSIIIFIPVRNSKATDNIEDSKVNNGNVISSDDTTLSKDNSIAHQEKGEKAVEEETDKLFKYMNKDTGELFIPAEVSEISDLDVMYLCRLHAKERPIHIIVDKDNSFFDSRENCDAIIEKSTGKLVLGCENTTIPDSVNGIADYAFANCAGLTAIKIPDSVSKIGKCAFMECRNLKEIDIPEGITEINIGTFSTCGSLSSVSLPESVISINDYAFSYCGRLSMINLPDAIIENGLGEDSFIGCFSLNESTKNAILEKNPNAYKLNLPGDDLSNVEYHFKEEAPNEIEYIEDFYYGVLDSLDQFGNLSLRVVEYSEDSNSYVFTGETRNVKISDDCKIIVRGKTEKSEEKLRYLNENDLRYICDYYTVAMDGDSIEEIIMREYVYPFICIEENGKMIMLRENA